MSNTIYIPPFDEIPEGSVIEVDGRCYTKTGNTGTMTHYLSAAPTFTTSCSACEDNTNN